MHVGKTIMNRIINILCLLMLIGMTVYLIVRWKDIPNLIPAHYNIAGEVDRFGDKISILICPIMSWMLYILITVLECFPQIWNTGVKVTEKNRERVYAILRAMIDSIKLVLVFVFLYLTVCMAELISPSIWFTVADTALILGIIIVSMIRLYRVR